MIYGAGDDGYLQHCEMLFERILAEVNDDTQMTPRALLRNSIKTATRLTRKTFVISMEKSTLFV
jgi:hypothetical protein